MEYRSEYAKQAGKLSLFGWTDEQIAWFFDVPMHVLAKWAMDNQKFFQAITPTERQRLEYAKRKRAKREVVNAAKRKRRAGNPCERIRDAVRARMWAALKGRTDGRLFSRLGYEASELVRHLETQFKPGMSWANYGLWHVDHIKPCSSFDQRDERQFKECWALSNLQPLWGSENMKKGAKHGRSEG